MKKYANLTEKVCNQILELMVNGEITPGQKLTFIDLAKQFVVSRTPVNNALSLLAQDGYLDFTPNRGYTVHKLTAKEAKHLRGIQEVLEIGFIDQVISNITAANKLKLKICKDDYAKTAVSHTDRKLFLLDILFHTDILDLADNPVLSNGYRHICRKLYLRLHDKQPQEEQIKRILEEHDNLYQALCDKDGKQARWLLKLRQTFLAEWYQLDARRIDRFEEKITGRGKRGKQSFSCSFGF
ncbi:MAG: GntR family transcriptional regulator [Pseudomonadota bacterium]